MKALYLIALLAFSVGSLAQENETESPAISNGISEPEAESPVYNTAGLQEQPQFPGGQKAFGEFIMSNFYAPPIADGPKTVKAYISFVVEKDGTVTSIKTLRDPGYGIGDEAIRVLKLSPKWKPGVQNGKPVRAMFNLPLTLNLKRATTSKTRFRQ